MGVRADAARRRPEVLRYFYLAEGEVTVHVGTTLGALHYVLARHGIRTIYLADIVSGHVTRVTEPPADFMRRWRQHYDDPHWDYFHEVDGGAAATPTNALTTVASDQLEATVSAAVREALRRLASGDNKL